MPMGPGISLGWQDRGKSSPSMYKGMRGTWGELLGVFPLRGLWKGQQGLPKPVVLPFPLGGQQASRTKEDKG